MQRGLFLNQLQRQLAFLGEPVVQDSNRGTTVRDWVAGQVGLGQLAQPITESRIRFALVNLSSQISDLLRTICRCFNRQLCLLVPFQQGANRTEQFRFANMVNDVLKRLLRRWHENSF